MKTFKIISILLLNSICGFSQSCIESYNKMETLYKAGKANEAISVGERAVPICEKELGKVSTEYATFLYNLAGLYKEQGFFVKAEVVYLEILAIKKKILGVENSDYASSLYNLAALYSKKGEYLKAESIFIDALATQKSVLGAEHPDYLLTLNDLAVLYNNQGNFAKAEPLFVEALIIKKKGLGTENIEYATSLHNLAGLYNHQGKYAKAEVFYIEALEIRKKILGTENAYYANSLNDLAFLYFNTLNYKKAETLFINAIAIRKKILGIEHPDYAASLNNLAFLYTKQGKYSKAEPLFIEALDIRKKVLGINHIEYAESLNNLAALYKKLSNNSKAESLILKALAVLKKVRGIEHPDYATSMTNLADLYFSQGNYSKAEPLILEAFTIRKKVLGIENKDYASSLNDLAVFYNTVKKYSKAEPLYIEALIIMKRALGIGHPDYAKLLNSLAIFYIDQGKYSKAEPLILEALTIQNKVLGTKHPDYATSLNNLAGLYDEQRMYAKAESLYLEALAIRKKVLGSENSDHTDVLDNLAFLYKKLGNNKYLNYLKELLSSYQKQITQQCSFQTTNELSKFLKKKYSYFDRQISLVYTYNPIKNIANCELFNTEILLKNLTLRNSEIVQNKIRQTKDTFLQNTLEQFQLVKRQLNKYAGLPKSEQPIDIKDLENEAEKLEKKLILGSQAFKEASEFTAATWINVQQALKKDEIAIEFVSYRYYNNKWTDSTLYCAMVIRPDYAYPKIISLFEQKQLDSLLKRDGSINDSSYINQLYGSKSFALYNLIVKPIDSLLQGVNTIYASASGLLHTINLPLIIANKPDGKKFNVHLVGSTGELTQYTSLQLNKTTIQNAFVFGGINYENASNTNISFKSSTYTPGFEQMASVATRGGINSWGYLPGTLTEATQIEKLNNKAGVKATVLSGTNASETNFKNLNGIQNPFILHLATHGYFFPNAAKEKPKDLNFFSADKRTIFKWSDDPLLRSGLILAGGNKTWKNAIPSNDSTEDGILTSMEVAIVDLSNCKLAVLSACETGLGDINGSEGVFGLQRGFKLSGVKNIIMSLWKIPDTQSAELLTMFYENCFSGLTVHESLKQAQLAMSKKYPVYYWAGFVLLE